MLYWACSNLSTFDSILSVKLSSWDNEDTILRRESLVMGGVLCIFWFWGWGRGWAAGLGSLFTLEEFRNPTWSSQNFEGWLLWFFSLKIQPEPQGPVQVFPNCSTCAIINTINKIISVYLDVGMPKFELLVDMRFSSSFTASESLIMNALLSLLRLGSLKTHLLVYPM